MVVAAGLVACHAQPSVDHAALRSRLSDGRDAVRLAALAALAPVADRADVAAMGRAAANGSESVRIETAHALGRVTHESAVDALGSLLHDRLDTVRAAAVTGLAAHTGPKAEAYVVSAYEPGGALTRAAVASRPDLLSRAVQREAFREATRRDEALRSGDLQRRAWALEATGLAGAPAAKETLLAALNAPETVVARAAMQGLAHLGNREVLPALWDVVRTGSAERARAAAQAGGTLDAESAFDALATREDAGIAAEMLATLGRDAVSVERRALACRVALVTGDVSAALALFDLGGEPCRVDATTPADAARWYLLAKGGVRTPKLEEAARRALANNDRALAAGAATWLGATGKTTDGPLLAARALDALASTPPPASP
ncbi:MAG: hypothetical protein RL199_1227, partial [Pseudomonadota bacterium]